MALSLLAFGAFPAFGQTQTPNFAKIFSKHYEAALEVIKHESARIVAGIRTAGGDPAILVPVVFPEIVRFSMMRDIAEQAAMLRLYVDRGSSAANFSVGPFQMKPAFAEKIESELTRIGNVPAALLSLLAYDSSEVSAQRRERLLRLTNLDWQIRYLCAFQKIVEQRFETELSTATAGLDDRASEAIRIRFYAGAYNTGFDQSYAEIVANGKIAYFPDGKAMPGRAAFRYADLSLWFAEHDFRK